MFGSMNVQHPSCISKYKTRCNLICFSENIVRKLFFSWDIQNDSRLWYCWYPRKQLIEFVLVTSLCEEFLLLPHAHHCHWLTMVEIGLELIIVATRSSALVISNIVFWFKKKKYVRFWRKSENSVFFNGVSATKKKNTLQMTFFVSLSLTCRKCKSYLIRNIICCHYSQFF